MVLLIGGGHFTTKLFMPRCLPCKEMALGNCSKFIVVVPKDILRVAKMVAKMFPDRFLVSCKFPAGVWMVVVVNVLTAVIKITYVIR